MHWGFNQPMREYKAVEWHLNKCPECAAAYEPIEKIFNLIADIEHAKLGLGPPQVGLAKFMARIEVLKAEEAERGARYTATWPRKRPALAAVACLLIVAASLSVYLRVQPQQGGQAF